jgi:hypothetical protein
MQIAAPTPFSALRLAFAALAARAAEIGVFLAAAGLDYYFERRLSHALARIIAKLRISLLHRAFELIPTLQEYRPRPTQSPCEPPAYDETPCDSPCADASDAPKPHAPRPMGIVLWPVGRHGVDTSENRKPYYWMPDSVPTARLAGRFAAVAKILANPTFYARKLALILTRPPRASADAPQTEDGALPWSEDEAAPSDVGPNVEIPGPDPPPDATPDLI